MALCTTSWKNNLSHSKTLPTLYLTYRHTIEAFLQSVQPFQGSLVQSAHIKMIQSVVYPCELIDQYSNAVVIHTICKRKQIKSLLSMLMLCAVLINLLTHPEEVITCPIWHLLQSLPCKSPRHWHCPVRTSQMPLMEPHVLHWHGRHGTPIRGLPKKPLSQLSHFSPANPCWHLSQM